MLSFSIFSRTLIKGKVETALIMGLLYARRSSNCQHVVLERYTLFQVIKKSLQIPSPWKLRKKNSIVERLNWKIYRGFNDVIHTLGSIKNISTFLFSPEVKFF